jgi:hypothetical protein
MESEDSSEQELDLDFSRNFHPFLRLYEQEESRTRTLAWTTNGVPDHDLKSIGRGYRFRRFLDSMKGFHSGSLDLSGRHLKVLPRNC